MERPTASGTSLLSAQTSTPVHPYTARVGAPAAGGGPSGNGAMSGAAGGEAGQGGRGGRGGRGSRGGVASAPVATRATTLRYRGVGVPPGAVRRPTTAAAAKAAKAASAKVRGAAAAEENASPTSMVEAAGIYSHVAT
ncbi:unnamed protein product, partial [Pylaiella littoralis]